MSEKCEWGDGTCANPAVETVALGAWSFPLCAGHRGEFCRNACRNLLNAAAKGFRLPSSGSPASGAGQVPGGSGLDD